MMSGPPTLSTSSGANAFTATAFECTIKTDQAMNERRSGALLVVLMSKLRSNPGFFAMKYCWFRPRAGGKRQARRNGSTSADSLTTSLG